MRLVGDAIMFVKAGPVAADEDTGYLERGLQFETFATGTCVRMGQWIIRGRLSSHLVKIK